MTDMTEIADTRSTSTYVPEDDAKLKLSIKGLYKIFGPEPEKMMEHVSNGMGKAELLAEHGHVLGLNNINIDMYGGKITVIMGLSGSGKSTLIRHLNRLIEPTTGKVVLDGEDVLALNPAELRQMRQTKMSMVFQKFALLPHRTVLENVATCPVVRGEDKDDTYANARKWLKRVGLAGYDDQYPHQLSGGQQQRVGIARALCSEAEIMLMDEAFSALDPIIRTDMQTLLLELQEELHKTIIFITHDLDEALRLADHLVILKDGAIVQQTGPQRMILNPADEYVETFVGDINRARVLRVRSVMEEGVFDDEGPEIDHNDTLEDAIEISMGAHNVVFTVMKDGEKVGRLDMTEVLKALVPRRAT